MVSLEKKISTDNDTRLQLQHKFVRLLTLRNYELILMEHIVLTN